MFEDYVDEVLAVYKKAGYSYKSHINDDKKVNPVVVCPNHSEDTIDVDFNDFESTKLTIALHLYINYPEPALKQLRPDNTIQTKLIVGHNNDKLEHNINEFLQTEPMRRLIDIKLQYSGTGSMALIIS